MAFWENDKILQPTFAKEEGSAYEQLEQLRHLREELRGQMREMADWDIKCLESGIAGEEKIAFELKNSHIPMLILHDLYLKKGDLSAQIDYLLITTKCTIVVECKNLFGNIEINNRGDFIRTAQYGRNYKKEGIYSPVTQNARHLELIKELRMEEMNILMRKVFEKSFQTSYRSVIVLANAKTLLNDRYAPKEVRNHTRNEVDYTQKYKKEIAERNEASPEEKAVKVQRPVTQTEVLKKEDIKQEAKNIKRGELCPKCGAELVKRVAKKGNNAGKEFWGCSNYPKCRFLKSIEQRGM